MNRAAPRSIRPLWLAAPFAICLFAGTLQVVFFSSRIPLGFCPDERAHVSYARDTVARDSFVPRLEAMKLLEQDGTFGQEPNYLPHPPFSYRLAAFIEGITGRPSEPGLTGAIRSLRRASVPLFALTLALLLACTLPFVTTLGGAVLFGAAVLSTPMLYVVGGTPNPDTLALLGGAVATGGALRAVTGRPDLWAGLLLGIGAAIASLSKLSGTLLVGSVLFLVVIRAAIRKRDGGPEDRAASPSFYFAALAPLLLTAIFWLGLVARYQTPLPSLRILAPATWAASAWAPDPSAHRLSSSEWLLRSLRALDFGFRSVASHVAVPASGPASIPLRLLPLAALAGLALGSRGEKDAGILFLLRSAAAVGIVAFALHFFPSHRGHLETGRLFVIQSRYFHPLLPLALLAAVRGVERIPNLALQRTVAWGGAALLLTGEIALLRTGRLLGVL